ncbi:halocyanin domain-containing protein [Haloplanus halophilus]|uniref:halocyanin domain-containing protein n=1 Tax=Haloplanus halophilus TaxID=2949993 RepID=UPI00203EDC1F|nr:halocyanin domain-containing protein [Haloplanus sp. GDY1]
MSEERNVRLGRRRLLRAGAGAVGAGLVGAGAAGPAAAQSGPFGGWMSDVSNYDGVVDMTGSGEVTVDVGVQANNAAYGFGPAAIQVDTGTTVVWEWTGEGNLHNVVAESGGDFESELTQEAGFTFEHTFESEGVVQYFCQPHRALGMKGVVVVGDAVPEGAEVVGGGGGGGGGGSGSGSGGGSGSSGGSGGSGGEGSTSGSGDGGMGAGGRIMSLTIGGSLVAAFLSPVVFGIVLMLRNAGGASPEESGVEHGDPSHED